MQYLGHTYMKKIFIVHTKFNQALCILLGNSTRGLSEIMHENVVNHFDILT